MKWEGGRQSDNVEDLRGGGGARPGRFRVGGGRGIGLGGVVVALVAGWIFGVNPLTILGLMGGDGGMPVQQAPAPRTGAPQDDMGRFVSVVLADTEDVWRDRFAEGGARYEEPKLVLFEGRTPTACGTGDTAMGPFYCPGDRKVYIDLAFYRTLRERLGAPGDFAQAYVIAHEVGHHVQNLLGLTGQVDAMRGRVSAAQQNALSVKLELQADCFAGLWAHHAQRTRQIVEQGDLEEALNAAAQIGDDTLQKRAGGAVVPESFTHGSSAQRVAAFRRGWENGRLADCGVGGSSGSARGAPR